MIRSRQLLFRLHLYVILSVLSANFVTSVVISILLKIFSIC